MKQIAYGVFAWVFLQVRRKTERGSTERHFIHQTDLTEPQGKLKK